VKERNITMNMTETQRRSQWKPNSMMMSKNLNEREKPEVIKGLILATRRDLYCMTWIADQ